MTARMVSHAQGNEIARRRAEAEHTRVLQTTARVPAIATSREGYAERTLSVRRCPGRAGQGARHRGDTR
jgi:hypothetical protein